MAKRILTLCLALVIGIAFAMPATAAVKSIKVGGDLTIRGIYRQNLDFGWDQRNDERQNDVASWLMSTTRIWVNADLTDNVSAVVRLLNERDWASYGGNDSPRDSNITLDLAYIQMKDLFMPGLSATIGRQEILLGKGFVVGNVNGRDGNFSNIRAGDLTASKSFDAVRADYEVGTIPLTVTIFDAKLSEHAPDNNDIDFYGVNVGYKTDNFKVEGYGLLYDRQTGSHISLQTYGARIDHNVFPGLNYNIEAALQTGDYWWARKMEGWAGNGDVSYTFQTPMQLQLGAAWFYASGDKSGSSAKGNWVPLYPDNLGDRIGRITYASLTNSGFGTPGSNMSVPKIYASFKPSEKSTVAVAWFPASTVAETSGSDDIGWGVNSGITYQYTEDLSLGLNIDYAHAGKAIPTTHSVFGSGSEDAWQAIGTVAVKF